jgi:hypothetical protein
LAARRRGQAWPFLLATLAIVVSLGVDLFRTTGPAHWDKNFAGRVLAAFALLATAMMVRDRLTCRADRRIGRTLLHRVSRSTAASVPTMLGPARMASMISALTLEAALAVTLLLVHHGWLAWTFPLAFAAASGCVVVGVRHAATRATVAVDPVSLTIDERLRSDDAFGATFPLFFLLLVFGGSTTSTLGPGWLEHAWKVGAFLVFGLWVWGMTSGPWRARSALPGSWLAQALSWGRP